MTCGRRLKFLSYVSHPNERFYNDRNVGLYKKQEREFDIKAANQSRIEEILRNFELVSKLSSLKRELSKQTIQKRDYVVINALESIDESIVKQEDESSNLVGHEEVQVERTPHFEAVEEDKTTN